MSLQVSAFHMHFQVRVGVSTSVVTILTLDRFFLQNVTHIWMLVMKCMVTQIPLGLHCQLPQNHKA